jgi:pSer/pThr/pTyr-binding forkhead associated (FHA) protein
VIAQELLDALNKAQNETDLDQVAVWALSKYLQGAWKDNLAKNIRPFDLGQALSNFYVDLSQHRLPEKITKQTPQTEALLMNFFGAAQGSKSHFWAQCIEIWSLTLQPDPVYAKDVKKYFDMLLRSSQPAKPLDPAAAPLRPPAGSIAKTSEAQAPAPGVSPENPEPPAAVKPAPLAVEPPIVEPAPLASAELVAPLAADIPDPAVVKRSTAATGPLTPYDPIKIPAPADLPAAAATAPVPPAQPPAPKAELESKTIPRNAYLVLQGTRVIPLNRTLIKIGRQLDNHIILEDPRVSRSHAQIKLVNDRFVIFDMHSTGGTFVNGQPTSQSVLYPGDVVSLAGVVFIFSQEMPAKPGDMKIIELGSPYAADRPTAIIHREEIKPQKKFNPKDLPDLPKTGPLSKYH